MLYPALSYPLQVQEVRIRPNTGLLPALYRPIRILHSLKAVQYFCRQIRNHWQYRHHKQQHLRYQQYRPYLRHRRLHIRQSPSRLLIRQLRLWNTRQVPMIQVQPRPEIRNSCIMNLYRKMTRLNTVNYKKYLLRS